MIIPLFGFGGVNPKVISIAPTSGAAAGGTSVTITGSGFANGATVKFGSTSATGVVWNNANSIDCDAPSLAPGIYDVNVTNPDLTLGSLPSAWTAVAAPAISLITPFDDVTYPTGLQDPAGGTDIVITGTGFQNGATVDFQVAGVTQASGMVTFDSPTQLTVTTPALSAGPYDVLVTNPDTQDSGSTGDGLHESWEILQQTWTAVYTPGTYSGGLWPDASGNAHDANWADGVPAEDAGCPDMNGTNDYLLITESLVEGGTPLATQTAGSMLAIFEADAADADAGDYLNPAIISGTAASPGIYYSDAGFKAVCYDDTTALYVPAAAGAATLTDPHIGFCTWSATELRARVDAGPFVVGTLDTGLPIGNVGPDTYIGTGYSSRFNGRIRLVAISDTIISDALCDKIRAWGLIKSLL